MEKYMKDTMLSWWEDEESKFIFENRLLHNENDDFIYIQNIVNQCVPELKGRQERSEEENELVNLLKNKRHIWVWGGGVCCTKFIREIIWEADIKIEGIIDKNHKKKEVLNIPVCTCEALDFQIVDCLIISMLNKSAIDDCVNAAVSRGMNKENIIVYRDYYRNMGVFDKLYFEDFIKYDDGETFVDAGVLDLDTSIRFAKECEKRGISNYKVYAFEPDEESYKKCVIIKEQHPKMDIVLYNKGLWSSNKTVYFESTGTGASRITDKENADSIEVVSLDSYVKEKVTFIKMDIEGAELEALKGCQNTIKRYRPKLAISVYHKKEDIVEIPKYIKSLVPDYHLYLRHYTSSFTETVLYALP